MNIFGFRPFKGKFNLGNSDDIPTNQDGTLIGSIKQINNDLDNVKSALPNKVLYEKTYSTTTQTWAQILVDFKTQLVANGLYGNDCPSSARLIVNNLFVYNLYKQASDQLSFCNSEGGAVTFTTRWMFVADTSYFIELLSTTSGNTIQNRSAVAIGSPTTLKLVL